MSLAEICIVEVNVGIAANGRDTHVSLACQKTCIEMLMALRDRGDFAMDETGFIFDEYKTYLKFEGEPGVGDMFFKWVNDVQWDETICRRESITPHKGRTFEEFPEDPTLAKFDRADRKYAALAKKCGTRSSVYNATDSDWKQFEAAFARNAIKVVNICPGDLKG
ncbi:MAG: hypothetical protein ABI318_07055 [Chthoniobacteraceae bacterium]